MFPWMFEQERALRPFKPAMDVLMEDTHFGTIYDADQLARNEVPLQAAVYFDDMYVDSGCSSTRCPASVVHIIGPPTNSSMTACMVPWSSNACSTKH